MDPAATVDPLTREANPFLPEVAADPFPFYEALRTRCPVAGLTGTCGHTHILSRYEDVRWALKHPEIFGSDLVAVDIGQDRPLIPLQIDPPAHAVYRRLIDPTLGPREVARMEGDVRTLVNRVIDEFIEGGTVDAHAQFTVPLPCTVFLETCGLPLDMLEIFLGWKDEIIRPGGGLVPSDEAAARRRTAGAAVYHYFDGLLDQRTARPGTDLLSRFVVTEIEGRRMTREEMLDICYLFILAGLDTVTSTLDCSLAYLAAHPQLRRSLVDDPGGSWAGVVEELLRLQTPVMQILRVVREPVERGGRRMAPGDTVILLLGAANTDPDEFGETAGQFVQDRQVNRHLAFGGGPHRCLGSHLARMELRVALEEWHRRIPDYEVVDGAQLIYLTGIREIACLPLEFTAAPVLV
jgi:cytochrome P450